MPSIRQQLVNKLQGHIGSDLPKCEHCGKTMKAYGGSFKCPYCDKSEPVAKSVAPQLEYRTEESPVIAGLRKSLKVFSGDRFLGVINQNSRWQWTSLDKQGNKLHAKSETEIIEQVLKHAGHPDQWIHTPKKYRLPNSDQDNPVETNVNDKLKEIKSWLEKPHTLDGQTLGDATANATIMSVHEHQYLRELVNTVVKKKLTKGESAGHPFRGNQWTNRGAKVSDEMFEALKQGSAGKHILGRNKDGSIQWTPERQALHKSIVENAVKDVPTSNDPTFYMLGGGPASGKSTLIKAKLSGTPDKDTSVHINADEVKEKIPEYKQMTDAKDPKAAAFAHEESSYLAGLIQDEATKQRKDVVLDGTGNSSIEKLRSKIEKAKSQGMRVKGKYVTVPTQVALDRAIARGKKTGRFVPESVITETHKSVSRIFQDAADLYDDMELYDTNGTPKLLFSAANGKKTVHDQVGYQAFLDKAK